MPDDAEPVPDLVARPEDQRLVEPPEFGEYAPRRPGSTSSDMAALPPLPPNPGIGDLPEPGQTVDMAEGETVGMMGGGQGYRILFESREGALSDAAGLLLGGLAQRMIENPSLRIRIDSFADDGTGAGAGARTVSLDRGFMIRTFLTDRGVRSTRVDVRALGDSAPEGPLDRVDLYLSSR
ncbi:hypothetical protein [Fodinicurvata sp. EGI_FJ10296]|uniref:OmpA family protein n=1 Tax=Fodinicurvata sp. EGI_FJ10296 TaxID=3231908 RepID=UPI003455A35B